MSELMKNDIFGGVQMSNIRKFIKKRCGKGGFIRYVYEKEIPAYTTEHVMLLRDEVKKDFPDLTDKHFGIEVDENNGVVITFYVHEIPNNEIFGMKNSQEEETTDGTLRKDVKYMLSKDWEPKVPSEETILKQAKKQLKRGKSTGSVSIDIKASKSSKDNNLKS